MDHDLNNPAPPCPEHTFTAPASEAAWDVLSPWSAFGMGEALGEALYGGCQ